MLSTISILRMYPIYHKKNFTRYKYLAQRRKEQSPIDGVVLQRVRAAPVAQPGELPVGHGKAAIHEPLQIDSKDPEVELRPPQVVP
mmetsp:Transcript_42844/g.51448  ORF Transcript_42844/g.51448 Transcript_42844/m.51448 type:complete len:86 (+) Transcript_42844:737-994(+)